MAFADSTSAELEQRLRVAIVKGLLVDLRSGQRESDDPAHGDDWEPPRTIRAETLIDLLIGPDPTEGARWPRALRLAGAKITGTLDLEAAELLCPVTLQSCWFEQPVKLAEATGSSLRLPGCQLPALYGEQLTLRGNLELNQGFTAHGEVNLMGAHIGGYLSFAGANLTNSHGRALSADGLKVDQSMVCSGGFTAQGEVGLFGARIGDQLVFTGARLTNPGGLALTADRIIVDRSMVCSGVTAHGEVRLLGAHIGAHLSFAGARLSNLDGPALSAPGLNVDQDMLCSEFTAEGEVGLSGAHIGGLLIFAGARLTDRHGVALVAHGLNVDRDMFCTRGFSTQGEVGLLGARIRGQLMFAEANLSNPGGWALNAPMLTVDQDMFCRGGFTADGEVNLRGGHISGALNFIAARLTNRDGPALTATMLTVDQDMLCPEVTAHGEVRLIGAHIRGQLNFQGASLTNPDGPALEAERLIVDQDMACGEGFTAQGEIDLRGAHIGGALTFERATLSNPDGYALQLQQAQAAILFLRNLTEAPVLVDLTHAQVGALVEDSASWPQQLRLRGFAYDALYERPAVSVRDRLGWLGRDPDGYSPQPYEQLGAVYRRTGREEDARRVAIAKQQARRRELAWPAKLWSLLLGALVGYGYRTWQAGVWLLGFVLAGWWIFDLAHPAHLVATKPPGERPLFHAGLYALDLLLPIGDLNYQGAWIARGWARGFWLAWILAGWVLATAVLAALAGLLKRD